MRTILHMIIIGIVLSAQTVFAYERVCSDVYGRPKYDDCHMAARRIPSSFKPVFFGPPGAPPGTIICPFVITYGKLWSLSVATLVWEWCRLQSLVLRGKLYVVDWRA